jgi:T5SS/PEP-CTERM-associated repeat protein
LFSSTGDIALGKSGGGNSLVVSNGAQLISGGSVGMGEASSCDNSLILISDANTLAVMRSLYPSANNSSVVVSNGATLRVANTTGSPLVFGDHNTGGNSNKLIVTGSGSTLTNWGSTSFLVANHKERGFYSNLVCRVEKGGAFYTGDLAIGGYHGDYKVGSNSVQVSTIVSDPQSLVIVRSKLWITKHLWDKTVNLVVTNGAAVLSQNAEIGYLGFIPTAYLPMGGSALVTGIGSVWSNQSDISLGTFTNSTGELTVCAGGRLVTSRVREGVHAWGTGTVVVADSGSALLATSAFYVGEVGQGSLTVKDGGALAVTNAASTAHLDLRRGTLTVANGGSVTADKLTFTNTVDTLTFVAGTSGLGTVKVKGALTVLAGSKLKIDLSGFTLALGLESEVLTLFDYGSMPVPFGTANVQVVGQKYFTKLTQGAVTADKLTLTVFRGGTMIMVY